VLLRILEEEPERYYQRIMAWEISLIIAGLISGIGLFIGMV